MKDPTQKGNCFLVLFFTANAASPQAAGMEQNPQPWATGSPLELRPQAKQAGQPPSKTDLARVLSASSLQRRQAEGIRLGPHTSLVPVPIQNFPEALTFQRPPSFPRIPAALTPNSVGLTGPETPNLSALGGLARPRRHQLQGL